MKQFTMPLTILAMLAFVLSSATLADPQDPQPDKPAPSLDNQSLDDQLLEDLDNDLLDELSEELDPEPTGIDALDDAIDKAKELAEVDELKVVRYDRQPSLFQEMLRMKAPSSIEVRLPFDPGKYLRAGGSPLMYLWPGQR